MCPLLGNNQSFQTVNINAGDHGQRPDAVADPDRHRSTANLLYVFPSGFTVGSGRR